MTSAERLKKRLERPGILILPGAYDAVTARIIERCGFEAVYVTGGGFANSSFGVPDVGLFSLSDLVTHVARIADVIQIPLVVDADTGYGGVLNVYRTVKQLEKAGAAAIQIEDQVSPKRCGHLDGTTVTSVKEMLQKIHAATDARTDPNLLMIIRTDARSSEGLQSAIDRSLAYVEAGADMIFIEAPQSVDELRMLPRTINAPLVANMVEGGKTPLVNAAVLHEMGFRAAIYANTALRVATKAILSAMQTLHHESGTESIIDDLIGWDERQALVGLPQMQALEAKFTGVQDVAADPAPSRPRG
jgi:2-methylisocitrate lyase-like PEP mutase family enzyme